MRLLHIVLPFGVATTVLNGLLILIAPEAAGPIQYAMLGVGVVCLLVSVALRVLYR